VAIWSKLASLPLLALYVALSYVAPHPASLGWGALGGAFGMVGVMLFYRALSAGAMAVVAPVTGVTSAAIPVVVGLVSGERPGTLRLVGVGCALLAIALVSLAPAAPGHVSKVTSQLIGLALASGAGFALFFIFLAQAGAAAGGEAGMWPVASSQASALLVGGLLLVALRPGGQPRGVALRWTLVAGPLDMTANAIFLLASRHGDLSLVAPLSALYPVSTVILALLIDHERLRALQVVGLVLALVALVLVSR
jgi:drug/metabolite transporter (DMT)-like permease